ncbi:MAG TPA: serine/threonine-protein kinase [Kofleriaceae bacterium]|nr:serine/threonine-protein kinase [Kofleriaceae bacterium]
MTQDPLLDSVVNDRYRVIRLLGEGGMSLVYEVQHVKLKRQFALKRLLPNLVGNEEAMIRFQREAELLASLRHPNIVDITDWDELEDGSPYMILEFLHGASIRVRMDRRQLSWEGIARFGDQTMAALALAHRIGITHRDLKPDNIFISIDDAGEERVKLLDFGVSKMRGLGRTTGQHAMLGTPSYMSPEQAQGLTDLIGPSTDVWAMGTILYEMATQKVAYTGESLVATVVNITSHRPEPITTFRPDAPAAFVDLIDRATSTDPERRITEIEQLRQGLRAALEPIRSRLHTPVAGMPTVTGSIPTPFPAGKPTSAPLGTASPAVSMQVPKVEGAVVLAPPSRKLNYWIIAGTALVAILGIVIGALVF